MGLYNPGGLRPGRRAPGDFAKKVLVRFVLSLKFVCMFLYF